jgi:hypothetical protein
MRNLFGTESRCGLLFIALMSSLSGCVSDYGFEPGPTLGQEDKLSATPTPGAEGGDSPLPDPQTSGTPGSGVPPNPATTPTPGFNTDSVNVPALDKTKIDMIFIVDNSGSMADEQTIIARSFGEFIDQFVQKDFDFHIGIITTDVVDPISDGNYWSGGGYKNYWNASRGNFLTRYSGEKWLTKDSLNLTTKFKQNILLGTSGSYREQGLNSLTYALEKGRIDGGGFNDGFLRPDSLLSVIVVSDEDEDIVDIDGNSPEQRIARVTKRLSELRGPQSKGFRFDFVVDLDESEPANITYPLSTGYLNSYPNVYLKSAQSFKSKTYNIRENFGSDLVNIGADIVSQAESHHKLSKAPVVASIVVKLGDQLVPVSSSNGYLFHADKNSIELTGSYLKNSPGKALSIQYQIK